MSKLKLALIAHLFLFVQNQVGLKGGALSNRDEVDTVNHILVVLLNFLGENCLSIETCFCRRDSRRECEC